MEKTRDFIDERVYKGLNDGIIGAIAVLMTIGEQQNFPFVFTF